MRRMLQIGLVAVVLTHTTGCIGVVSNRGYPRHQVVVMDGQCYVVDIETCRARPVELRIVGPADEAYETTESADVLGD